MMKHLRWKLSAFNTAVTSVILLGMTLLCLFVSERDTRARSFQSFYGYMDTVTVYVSGQGRLSAERLKQMEGAGRVSISIRDNGKPLFSMGLEKESLEEAYAQVRDHAKAEYSLDAETAKRDSSCAFTLEETEGAGYFAGLALIVKDRSVLELILLYPLEEMERGIVRQRLVVFLGEVFAVILLWVFSWHFTGRMLKPIAENQKRQAQFTAAASHELRTPLAAMLSAASAMERAEPEGRAKFSGIIRQEGDRMSRLIGDMLALSGGDSQNWTLQMGDVEPDMLLLECYERYFPLAKEKGICLSIQLPEAEVPMVQADRERIFGVLSILLDNALAYTPASGRIQLALEKRNHALRISVADTGTGVPDSEKARIFEWFHRGEKSRSDHAHFGLGLSIAMETVKLHKGKLWVEDAPGGGAVFILELPTR